MAGPTPDNDETTIDDANAAETAAHLPPELRPAAAKVRSFPQSPGIYLMKDASGVVIYVGKAKSLRSRAGSYFLKAATEEYRTRDWVSEIRDVDFIEYDSEVDALLAESRLIKDVQPKYNRGLKDDKTFPYLMITTREDFPRVEVTREPMSKGVKLYGPFAAPERCAALFKSCNAFLNSVRARLISRMATSAGIGSGPVSWPASINARLPVICAFPKKTTGVTSSVSKCFSKAINTACSSR